MRPKEAWNTPYIWGESALYAQSAIALCRKVFQHHSRQRIQWADFMRGADRDRFARHAEDHASRFILREIIGTGILHRQYSNRSVLSHPGENHAHRILACTARGGFEQYIHRRTVPIYRWPDVKLSDIVGAATCQQKMGVPGRDVGMPR